MNAEVVWEKGDRTVRWTFEGHQISKTYSDPPMSAVYLSDPPSIVVVEHVWSAGPSNAVVYDLDGKERVRLQPPPLPGLIGFWEVFASRTGVEAVLLTRGEQFHGQPDLVSGELSNVHEWR